MKTYNDVEFLCPRCGLVLYSPTVQYGIVSSAETPCRRVPDHVSVSRIAYFKRKFVDDDDEPPFSFRTYCQTVSNDTQSNSYIQSIITVHQIHSLAKLVVEHHLSS